MMEAPTMEALLDEKGDLHIKRRGALLRCDCPYNNDTACGDWCALFGEPEEIVSFDPITKNRRPHIELLLCQRKLSLTKLEDRRIPRLSKETDDPTT